MNNRGGDRDELFQRLYGKYYRRMVRFYVNAFHLSPHDAEDLAQDAFLKFYEAMKEYRGEAEWGFFETIARNLALNRIRSHRTKKRGAIRPIDIDDPLVKKHEPAVPPVDFAERQHHDLQVKRLREAIQQLSTAQRQCVQLRLEEKQYDEIARILRISEDAVKSRLRDARRILRERLGPEGELPEDE